jgi:hypothetical protein
MAQQRYHWANTKEYAKLHGISERSARRKIVQAAGAQKTGRGWRVPITNAEYARATGKAARTTRRQGILAEGPTDAQLQANLPGVSKRTASRTIVPTRINPGAIVHPIYGYQYQGWAIIRFQSSRDTIKVYSSRLPSPTAFTLVDLDLAIREDIEDRFMRSPIEILKTGPVLAHCYRRH